MAIGNPITLTNNVAAKVISATATANQTLFTVTGGYRINQIAVFRNGVRLVDSSDYTARDGASVTLLSAATEGDILEFQIFDDFRVADAIVSNESEQTISGSLNVTGGINVGIQSAGTQITTGVITAIVVAEPVTLPVKFPVNDVAVIIPAPASTPEALIVTAAPTIALPVVVTPVTTAPSGNSGDVPAVLPLKLVTLSVAIRDLRFEGHQ